MKHYLSLFILCLFLATSCVQESIEEPQMGTVSFSKITFSTFDNASPNGRVEQYSDWDHILPTEAVMVITDKTSGKTYHVDYDPSEITAGYKVQLPYGDYTVTSSVEGGDFETFLPFEVIGEFSIDSNMLQYDLEAMTDYGLVTVKATYVKSLLLDNEAHFAMTDDDQFYYSYVKNGLSPTLTIEEVFNSNSLELSVSVNSYNHYNFVLVTQSEASDNLIKVALQPFSYHNQQIVLVDVRNYAEDAEGNKYNIVEIGNQLWFAEDLRTSTYCNGETIKVFELVDAEGMDNAVSDQPDFGVKRLNTFTDEVLYYYNFAVASSSKNICPCNWRPANDEDWKELERFLGIPEERLDSYERGEDQDVINQLITLGFWDYGDVELPDNPDDFMDYHRRNIRNYYYRYSEGGFNAGEPFNINLSNDSYLRGSYYFAQTSSRYYKYRRLEETEIDRRNPGGPSMMSIRCVQDLPS